MAKGWLSRGLLVFVASSCVAPHGLTDSVELLERRTTGAPGTSGSSASSGVCSAAAIAAAGAAATAMLRARLASSSSSTSSSGIPKWKQSESSSSFKHVHTKDGDEVSSGDGKQSKSSSSFERVHTKDGDEVSSGDGGWDDDTFSDVASEAEDYDAEGELDSADESEEEAKDTPKVQNKLWSPAHFPAGVLGAHNYDMDNLKAG